MFLILCIFLIVSFFEIMHLFKIKEKKEAVIFIGIAVITITLAVFLLLTPDYSSFSKTVLSLIGIKQ